VRCVLRERRRKKATATETTVARKEVTVSTVRAMSRVEAMRGECKLHTQASHPIVAASAYRARSTQLPVGCEVN